MGQDSKPEAYLVYIWIQGSAQIAAKIYAKGPSFGFVEQYNQNWRLEKLAYHTPNEAREQYELRPAA